MRPVLVSPSWPPGGAHNGIVTYVSHLAPALRELGAAPLVVAMKHSSTGGLSDAIDLSGEPPPYSRAGQFALGLAERLRPGAWNERAPAAALSALLARKEGVDLVEMEESFGWAGRVARHASVPVVVRLHGPWCLVGPLERDAAPAVARRARLEGEALKAAAAVSAPSRDVLDRVRAHYGMTLPAAEVIPCPMPVAAPEARWRAEDCDPNRVLFVGRFDEVKGADTLLDAFALLAGPAPQARLDFVGPDRGIVAADGRRLSMEDYLRMRFPGDPAARPVTWHGPLPPERIAALRRRAAVTVVASRYETFGYTLAEAMAQGCPIVATRAGALPELVQDGVSGLLARAADAADLAACISRLLTDRAIAARLGTRAQQDSALRYSPAAVARHTLDFYHRVLKRRRRAGQAAAAASP